jgi:hypothetical protein
MRKLLLLFLLLPILSVAQSFDTTYILATVPATDPHNVLIEDFEGESCANSPAANTLLSSLASSSAARLNVITLYISDFVQTVPPVGSPHDLRNDTATLVANAVYGGLSALPGGGVDRVNNAQFFTSSSWGSEVATRMAVPDSLNLGIVSNYDVSSGKITVVVTVIYTQNVSSPQNLSIAVLEDSITDYQEMPLALDTSYQFNNVFRGFVTNPPYGDLILPSIPVKAPGRVYKSIYTFTPKSSWMLNHLKFVAFVNGRNTPHLDVAQSAASKLTGVNTTSISRIENKRENIFPNPVKDLLYIETPEPSSYCLLSIAGVEINQGLLKAGSNQISTNALPAGVFLLEVSNSKGEKTAYKIVKE